MPSKQLLHYSPSGSEFPDSARLDRGLSLGRSQVTLSHRHCESTEKGFRHRSVATFSATHDDVGNELEIGVRESLGDLDRSVVGRTDSIGFQPDCFSLGLADLSIPNVNILMRLTPLARIVNMWRQLKTFNWITLC